VEISKNNKASENKKASQKMHIVGQNQHFWSTKKVNNNFTHLGISSTNFNEAN